MNQIPLFKVFMPESVMPSLRETLLGGYIGQGPKVKEFEDALRAWLATPYVLALNSGTSALHLALRLAGVDYGDSVISTPMTCTATNTPIRAAGARILWADIDPWTGNMDPESVKKLLKDLKGACLPRAVLCVHWGGYPCDMEALDAITSEARTYVGAPVVIEDAAHAFGAMYDGKPIGEPRSYGFTCFSFQAIKLLTTVDGGALCCSLRDVYERGKLLRWYGIDREQPRDDFRCEADIPEWGYKFHMNDVAATIGLEQMKYIEANLRATRQNAFYYRLVFEDMKRIKLLRYEEHVDADKACGSFWLFTMRVKERDAFTRHMTDKGIAVSRVHARNDKHSMFSQFQRDLPGVDEFDREQISIPVGWWLTPEDVAYIVEAVKQFETQKS